MGTSAHCCDTIEHMYIVRKNFIDFLVKKYNNPILLFINNERITY